VSAAADAELKVATMVFADLVDSTGLATRLDPESLRGRLEPFFEIAREALEEHGGTLEKYLGDAVLAVFGVPRTHDDDPDRAVAAALALVERLGERDPALAVRIGIETGQVLSATGEQHLSVTGEAVTTAARLQQAALPGEILVGARCASACRRARLEPHDPVAAKGIEAPLRAWRAAPGAVPPDPSETAMLGRDDDLELLRIVYRRAARERAPQLVTISGDAGIGKTRLARELIAELRAAPDPPRILIGRSPSYGRGVAFSALEEILRGAAGAGADDAIDAVTAGIARLLGALGAEDAEGVADTLTLAIGGGPGEAERDSEQSLRRAWRRFGAVLASERPLVIVLDDAHWADDGLLDLLEETAFGTQDVPVVVLCTCRPALFERRPDFGRAARNVTQIELQPLERGVVAEIVAPLLVPEARGAASRIAAVVGGNPFFAEEVARSVAEDGEAVPLDRLPDTVQAAIAARMDALSSGEKRVLQVASVLGLRFRLDALEDLSGDEAGGALEDLTRKALVRERIEEGPGRFRFRHQLIRDVAYDSLTRRERAGLHERAAARLGDGASGQGDELAELAAYHLAQAAELEPSHARTEAAVAAARGAAERAHARGALAAAQSLYERAAELAPDGERRAVLLLSAGEVGMVRMRGDHGFPLMRRAAEVAEAAGESRLASTAYARAVEVGARMAGITGATAADDLRALLERARALAPSDDPAIDALLRLDEGWISWMRSASAARIDDPAEALAIARGVGDPRLLSSALDAAAAFAWTQHRYFDALELLRERLEMVSAAPRSPALGLELEDTRHVMIEALLQAGRLRESAALAAVARDLDLDQGMVYSAWERGLLPAFFLGDWDEVIAMAARVREAWLAEQRPPLVSMSTALATAGTVHGLRGNAEGEREWFEVARSLTATGTGGQDGGVEMLAAIVDLHRGDADAAARRLEPTEGGFWWHTPYAAARAEAFVCAGWPEADEALAAAEAVVVQHPYGAAITARARALRDGDPDALPAIRRRFAELECPFEEARTAWLAGGEHRAGAEATFRALGAVSPVPTSA
jgi:class 3 adenylate cyclase